VVVSEVDLEDEVVAVDAAVDVGVEADAEDAEAEAKKKRNGFPSPNWDD
jgi:hypothetical protein